MHRVIAPLALSVSLLSLCACPARTPAPRAGPPVQVPPGCEQNLAGEYHHAQNPAFRYLGEDDGDTLTLAVVRARGGPPEAPDGGTVSIILERTPEGFLGETRATGFTAAGTPCPVRFPTEVTACSEAGLTLRSAASVALGEDCRPAPSGPGTDLLQQVLVRGVPSPDAGG